MVAKDVHTLISRTYEYVMFLAKKDFADVIKVQTLKQIMLDYLSRLNQIPSTLKSRELPLARSGNTEMIWQKGKSERSEV